MPYSMLHLTIGQALLSELPVADSGRFLLGCVAPDAVHFHPSYVSELKRISHFVPDGVAWGDCREEANPIWLENVRSFLSSPPGDAPRDFLLGYASHVLGDIYNNMTIWTPLRRRAEAERRPELIELYRQESAAADRALYGQSEAVLQALSGARVVGVRGRIEAADVERMRLHLLSNPCAGQTAPDFSSHRCLTAAVLDSFLAGAAEFTVKQLQKI